MLGEAVNYIDYLEEDLGIVGTFAQIPPNPLNQRELQMAIYDPVNGFIVCSNLCYHWKEPAFNWTQMTIFPPSQALSGTQVNMADGKTWIIGGRTQLATPCKCCDSKPPYHKGDK